MTRRGQSAHPLRLETLVAASFLGNAVDTKVQRAVRDIGTTADRSLLETVVDSLRWPAEVAGPRIDSAIESARAALDAADRLGLTVLDAGREEYPELLRQIPDPPIVLFVKGHVDALTEPQVAVVGSRVATPTGVSIGRQLARELAGVGITVVSGMARGVDGAAHAGALEGGGRTIAVLGCGVDVVYPAQHRDLAARIAEAGAIVSELAPGAPPLSHHFPLRNRIISGLSRAVVVIEASDRSGSLITAQAALDQGRDVLAVPGGVLSGRSRGCHKLIRDGARIVESVNDILEEIGWTGAASSASKGNKSLQMSQLEETMAAGESYTLDELAARTGRTAGDLLAELGELELSGRVSRAAGGGFIRT